MFALRESDDRLILDIIGAAVIIVVLTVNYEMRKISISKKKERKKRGKKI